MFVSCELLKPPHGGVQVPDGSIINEQLKVRLTVDAGQMTGDILVSEG